jgi:hypothetical protein
MGVSPVPRLKLTRSSLDALPTPASDVVYRDCGCPGFGVKIIPRAARCLSSGPARAVLARGCANARSVVMGASRFIRPAWPHRRSSQPSSRDAILRVRSVRPGAEPSPIVSRRYWRPSLRKRIAQPLGCRDFPPPAPGDRQGLGRKEHSCVSKRDVVEFIATIEQRGAPIAADKTLKSIKTFLCWCVGRAIRNAKPGRKLTKLSDGGGLHLPIQPHGTKLWRMAYRHTDRGRM